MTTSVAVRPLPYRLSPLLIILGLVASFVVTDSADAQRKRRLRKVDDDDLPLVFVGMAPGMIDGRSVNFIGIDPEFVRLEYAGEKFDVPNEEFHTMNLSGASWKYNAAESSFMDMVDDLSKDNDFHTKYGAEGRRDDVTTVLAEATAPKKPAPVAEPVAAAEPAPRPVTPAASSPQRLPAPVEQPVAAPEEEIPFDVPDWLKYAAAAAAVIVVINFFRN